MRTSYTLAALTGLLLLAGCDQQPLGDAAAPAGGTVEEAADTLELSLASAPADVVAIDVSYTRRADQAAPRMMELWVSYDGDLTFIGAEPLAALEAAGKELVVQDQGGELRIIAYAADNLALVESGPVARLTFSRSGGVGATVALEPRSPFFAPAAANEGVLLGAALRIPEGTP